MVLLAIPTPSLAVVVVSRCTYALAVVMCLFVTMHTYVYTCIHTQTERSEQFEQRARLLECEVRAQQITAGTRMRICVYVCSVYIHACTVCIHGTITTASIYSVLRSILKDVYVCTYVCMYVCMYVC